jgi:ribosomal protein S18 acetylase RimI-like enzyme
MIRRMEKTDIPRIAEIQVFAWRYSERGIYSDEELFKNLTVIKRIEDFEYYTKDSTEGFYVFDDGIVKAFFIVYECPNEDEEDENDKDKENALHIESIYVDPFFQRKGIGSQLINHIEEIARRRNYTEVNLSVLEKNENARLFYEKMGYTPDGKKSEDEFGAVDMRYVKEIK